MSQAGTQSPSRAQRLPAMKKCLICGSKADYQFSKKILNKFNGNYFKCTNCGLLFMDKPTWLQEAYTEAISSLDIGLIQRNLYYSKIVHTLISRHLQNAERFLDYAGGYGLFARLMRDMGHNFYRQDNYCANIFARHFDVQDLPRSKRKFDLITAFEVFEHFTSPEAELRKMMKFGHLILFSTELAPSKGQDTSSWWYLAPETGQHITFFTLRSLAALSSSVGLRLYSNGKNLHLFAPATFTQNPFLGLERRFGNGSFDRLWLKIKSRMQQLGILPKNKESLIARDYAAAVDLLKNPKNRK